jgi:ABC-type sugar transport system ATPase subunit
VTGGTVLAFRGISKSFPGVKALDDVNLDVKRGEVHAIVGENGAGKSTLMKIAAGIYQPDSGQISLNGEPVQITSAQRALRLGIAMVPQELNLVPEMTVAENILLGAEPRKALGVVDWQRLRQQACEILAALGVGIDVQQKVKNLTVAQQQMVQIARATGYRCTTLIMDEPTASLSQRETEALFKNIRRFREQGTTILYISHRMQEVFDIADRITVLRDGQLICSMDRADATEESIVRAMIGRALRDYLHEREHAREATEVVLEGRELTREGLFEDVSFALHRGEILGFAGLVGARRTEVFASVFGFAPLDRGEMLFEGKPVKINRPADAIRLGIGYVPEERKRLGLFLVMSVLHNISLPFLDRVRRWILLRRNEERAEAARLSEQLRVQTPSLAQQVRYLSGGNQQKVILARWLGSGAQVLILDEPTRGIDVNAKVEIHALIGQLAAEHRSIILISSELQELLGIADRVIVMREGRVVGELDPKQSTEEDVLRMAMWGTREAPPAASRTGLAACKAE